MDDVIGEITATLKKTLFFSRITRKEGWKAGICRAVSIHQSFGCPVVVQTYSAPYIWTPFMEISSRDGMLCVRGIGFK